ncbi:hypothetical protein [Glutamicibacter ardleyensis]|uniref:hypothetical protein n=1 Tax=Glutamicibacter ardleyensis TaxID=225894 RepID=UPI003FCF04D2
MSSRIMIFQQTAKPVLIDVLVAGINGACLSYVQQIINYRELAPAYERWKDGNFTVEFGRVPEAQFDKLATYSSAKLTGIKAWFGDEKLCLIPDSMSEAVTKKFKKYYEPVPILNVNDESSKSKNVGIKGIGHPTLVFPDDESSPEKRIQQGIRALLKWFDKLPRSEQVRWYDADMPAGIMLLPGEHCMVEPMTALSDPQTMQIETVKGVQQSACAVITTSKQNQTVGHLVDWWSNESSL